MLKALAMGLAGVGLAFLSAGNAKNILHVSRASAGDLEIGGDLAGLPPGATRYIRYEDLLRLPQETYTVNDDSNLPHGTKISGVPLAMLAQLFAGSPSSALIVAICYDRYRTNYPMDYVAEHRPLLVLRINGQARAGWPKSEHGGPLGPYLISHPYFKPTFKVLSHEDEPQIPFGVVRIEFHPQAEVFGAIKPRGNWPANSPVEQGYEIARQDCVRCHNMGVEGGTMAGHSWLQLGAMARHNSARFQRIIHDPKSVTPGARMPAHGDYDQATLDALTAYFRTFSVATHAARRKP